MAKSPEAVAAAAVARIQQDAFQAGLKQGRTEGFELGWEACAEKITSVVQAKPSIPRAIANAKSRSASDSSGSTSGPSDELEVQQWVQLAVSMAPNSFKSYWELLPDYLEKDARPIEELDISVMTYNALKREAVHTIGDVTRKSLGDFFCIRNFAEKSFRDLYAAMAQCGYGLVTREE